MWELSAVIKRREDFGIDNGARVVWFDWPAVPAAGGWVEKSNW